MKQKGLSLPEVLIALACSSLLMMTLMNQYLGVKRYYKHAQTTLESWLDVQLITDLMRDTIRQAGFTPCLGVEHLTTLDTRTNRTGLLGVELGNASEAAIQINHMRNEFSTVISTMSPTELVVTQNVTFLKQRPIIIADCYHAEVHTLHSIHRTSGAWIIRLNRSTMVDFHPPIYIGEWLEESFFIRNQALHYRLGHVDRLSTTIHQLHAVLKTHQRKRLLHVELSLENDEVVQFDAMVRTS